MMCDQGRKPLAIDLFCGLGGWTEGLLAEGYRVVGYDIEAHEYGDERYPAELVLADVLDLHGSQFADADLIVASPPCQEYSYMAMPWSLAKAKAAAIRADETGAELARLNRLFHASFRIQREAIEAAGRHIPLVVENVRGAIPWVGRSRWNYGAYHLWGDVPALMPLTVKVPKMKGRSLSKDAPPEAKWGGHNVSPLHIDAAQYGHSAHDAAGTKIGGDWFSDPTSTCRRHGSKSKARKAASARIAKIPLTLSRWIAAHYKPQMP